jgi:hypothetical protein
MNWQKSTLQLSIFFILVFMAPAFAEDRIGFVIKDVDMKYPSHLSAEKEEKIKTKGENIIKLLKVGIKNNDVGTILIGHGYFSEKTATAELQERVIAMVNAAYYDSYELHPIFNSGSINDSYSIDSDGPWVEIILKNAEPFFLTLYDDYFTSIYSEPFLDAEKNCTYLCDARIKYIYKSQEYKDIFKLTEKYTGEKK